MCIISNEKTKLFENVRKYDDNVGLCVINPMIELHNVFR